MQPESRQPDVSSPEHDALSQSNRKQRTSERSIRAVPERSEPSNASTTARRTLTRNSPQQGSSREMTPSEGLEAIKYTRTGRVSRANKGKRVHHCEECGKTYTRAEHLRRHQQNHKPGAFPCDRPGCSRSFHREDLLVRHKVRHDDPVNPVTPLPSPQNRFSEPSTGISDRLSPYVADEQQASVSPDPETLHPSAPQMQEGVRGHRMIDASVQKHSPDSFTAHARIQYPLTANGHPELDGPGSSSDSSFPYPSTGDASPTHPYFHELPFHHPYSESRRQSSSFSYLGHCLPTQHTSPSPVSVGSSTAVIPPYWVQGANEVAFQYLGAFPASDSLYYSGNGTANIHLFPEYRDVLEQAELSVPMISPESSTLNLTFDEVTYTNENRYLAAYWRSVHALYPVVHQPSFNPHTASPLLRASMIALGAQALNGTSDQTTARLIHERCVKVLKKRTINGSHSFRICDLQAVVLFEIYSIFKSRRPPFEFSKHFEDVYQFLASDPAALHTNSEQEERPYDTSTGVSPFDEGIGDGMFPISDSEYKQRLLLACYMLDQQHTLLFGRQRSNSFSGDGADLPFPRSQASWDGHSIEQQNVEELIRWPVHNIGDQDQPEQHVHDVFQSMLLVSSFFDSRRDAAIGYTFAPGEDLAVLPVTGGSTCVQIAYHTLMLCENTPIRDLLAVAGETWVMAEKLDREEEYTTAQLRSMEWATERAEQLLSFGVYEAHTHAQRAVTHALKILELHRTHPKTGLLFQEWGAYLASVVIWARAYVRSGEVRGLHDATKRRLSMSALERTVSSVFAAGPDHEIDLDDAMGILQWTKNRIESVDVPHNCGLRNGALGVLGKLVARGRAPGWFGS